MIAKVHYSQTLAVTFAVIDFGYSGPWLKRAGTDPSPSPSGAGGPRSMTPSSSRLRTYQSGSEFQDRALGSVRVWISCNSSPGLRPGPDVDPSEADERVEDGADHLEQVGLELALQRRDCCTQR